TIDDTIGMKVQDSDVSGFRQAVILSSGHDFFFSGNKWHDNPGNPAGGGTFYVYYVNGGVFSSIGHPVTSLTIDSDKFSSNKTYFGVGSFSISTAGIRNADAIKGITIRHTIFQNNNTAA